MAMYQINDATLTAIADAIRAKTGSAALIDAADFADEIEGIPGGAQDIELIMSNQPFVTQSSVSGTNTERTVRTFQMTKTGKVLFAAGTYGYTNTGANDGFFDIRKNDNSIIKQYCTTNTNTPVQIPEIDVENGDEIAIVVGFDNQHSACNFQLYSAMAIISETSASLASSEQETEPQEEQEEMQE